MQNHQNRIPEPVWNDTSRYQDIMGLSRPVSVNHPPMDRISRAAQFSPFSALTGHGEAIRETARLTSPKKELDGYSIGILNEKLQILRRHLADYPEVTITYFEPDDKKEGGNYQTLTAAVKKIDGYRQALVLQDGMVIPMQHIIELDCRIFEEYGLA